MSKQNRISKIRHKIKIPKTKWQRTLLGWSLVIGGVLGFLPVVGFWMLPLGIMVLAIDSPFFRRVRRRSEVWWGRKRQKGMVFKKPDENK